MNIYDELKTAYGNHFQDLFSKLMKEKYGPLYQPTITYGNAGDKCVDGVLNYDTAYAVYAPETYRDSNAIAKLKSDFNGFMKHRENGYWKQIQKYIFVIKIERNGVTSAVFNLISQFREVFNVEILTLEDLKLMEKNYLPFSDDGRLLFELKEDVTEVMEYIIETDFSAEPFFISLIDSINFIIEKWKKRRYTFKEEKVDELKNTILRTLNELSYYFDPLYVHILPNNVNLLMFNNDSIEAGERLRNELQPQTYRIRQEVYKLYTELYNIK